MFDRITLGVKGDTNLIKSRLYNHPECVFPISIAQDKTEESVTYINFDPSDDLFILDQYLNVVAEYIIDRYETRLLKRMIDEDYGELTPLQKREVLKNAERYADDIEIGYQARKRAVLLSVYDYLQEDSTMLIDGFVTFRLKEYETLLSRLAQRLVEQYVTQKEYEEFIGLLKYFVNIQQPRPFLVHVCIRELGGYVIIDERGEDITAQCFSDFLEGEILLSEDAYDDLLISVLITLAPERITIHNSAGIRNKELFTTINQVFDGQVDYCAGCALCAKA